MMFVFSGAILEIFVNLVAYNVIEVETIESIINDFVTNDKNVDCNSESHAVIYNI